MGKSKGVNHCVIRNSNLFCLNCGREQALPYPMEVEMFSAMSKAFEKIHKDCQPVWKQPEPDMSMSEQERENWWLKHGERGTSSETIFACISGRQVKKYPEFSHPKDPSDFHRCYLLLKVLPEWIGKLGRMKQESEVWSKLVDNWDKLTEMLEEQIRTDKANGMLEFMESLGC